MRMSGVRSRGNESKFDGGMSIKNTGVTKEIEITINYVTLEYLDIDTLRGL